MRANRRQSKLERACELAFLIAEREAYAADTAYLRQVFIEVCQEQLSKLPVEELESIWNTRGW